MLENILTFFLSNSFFLWAGGSAAPAGPAPLDPVCFWIEDPSRNWLALNGISAINPTRFFEKISNI